MDEKEQAWLRLNAFELAGEYRNPNEAQKTLSNRLLVADYIYNWAVTGEAPS